MSPFYLSPNLRWGYGNTNLMHECCVLRFDHGIKTFFFNKKEGDIIASVKDQHINS
jgi:hypothetical protein